MTGKSLSAGFSPYCHRRRAKAISLFVPDIYHVNVISTVVIIVCDDTQPHFPPPDTTMLYPQI
ncbi:MAG: hypothetical protein J6X83_02560, partial [Methanomicrobium sp.]|nr:hypothetical protein [Methanomicrobium sp.]